MKIVPVLVLTLVVSLAASLVLEAGRSQTLDKPIHVAVHEVPVDVVVMDRHGNPVLDLTRKNFTVLEDGVPQKIVHFSINSHAAAERPAEGTIPQKSGERDSSDSASRNSPHRTILILLGRGKLRISTNIPKLIEFIRSGLNPTDRVAIMAFRRATDFTTDREKLVSVLERFARIAPLIENKTITRGSRLSMAYGDPESPRHYTSDIDEIFALVKGVSRTVTSNYIPESGAELSSEQALLEEYEREEIQKALRYGGQNEPPSPTDDDEIDPGIVPLSHEIQMKLILDDLKLDDYLFLKGKRKTDREGLLAAVEYLRNLEGEKHIISLNDQGLDVPGLDEDWGPVAIAGDARVRIHSIQVGGAYLGVARDSVFSPSNEDADKTPPTHPRYSGKFLNSFTLRSTRELARLTGGESFAHQDLLKCLRRIQRDTVVSYLLAYVPEKKELDGRFRHIEVRVDRPGVRALHRRGYYASPTPKLYDREQFLVHSRITTAAVSEELIHDVDFSLRTQLVAGARPNLLQANLQVHPAASIYVRKDGRYAGKLAISYFIFGRDGDLVSEIWDDLDMALKPTTYERVLREGFPLEKQLEVPSGSKECLLRVVVYDVANDRVGSAEALIEGKR